ncbi:hypothetical protein UK23_10870 [Lentzea aerocolonigenes]|uniref:Uncharacterized protein n=1 Tax=Lentzea aerocolonigenes TaxID=68170 RepID=A0A0F0H3R3_LENAE|nr:hypothetical protein UK23_10870 [Lentzea aerocolonigenes]
MPADARAGAHPPGAPVAVGPLDADPSDALRQLSLLTDTAAGAGVDLGGGFTSARLAGAQGDRRDAVLAALKLLGADDRLGDRAANLVALFGPSATKRVGAAAHQAVVEQRWAALHLASAASDLLGPEQLERVLDLRAPEGIDPFPRGAASTLAEHLSRLLSGYQRPRRLTLIISLWDHVCSLLLEQQRRERRAESQTRAHRVDKLRERHRAHFDEPLMQHLGWATNGEPTLAAAARWRPPNWWAASELSKLLHDAIAATALLRFARTLSDEGLTVAAAKHRDELAAADACLRENERSAAARRVEGAYSHPARPGCYVHHLVTALSPERTITARTESYVQTRVAMARNYGVVVFNAVTDLLADHDLRLHHCWDTCKPWQTPNLHKWRAATGFSRTPSSWDQPPLTDAHADGPTVPLAQRLAEDPVAAETPHDLLWLADLADALAPFYGNDRASVVHERPHPKLTYDEPQPALSGSVPLAAAQVAQLVMFGATPPPRCGSWPELAAGVSADAVITEASTGAFPIPAEVSAFDKQTVAGLRVELGREPRQLAEWSGYMGNCIGESWYADVARKGQCVLMAFRTPSDGRIVANLDIRRHTGGWHVYELRARFNDDVTPALEKQIKQWVEGIPTPVLTAPEPLLPVPPPRARGGHRSPAGRLPVELTKALAAAVEQELASVGAARRTYARLARSLGRSADFEPEAAVIALKRLSPADHTDLLRTALAAGLDASVVWQATRARPLAAAVARLDPELRSFDRLGTLTDGSPLPRTLRALVRRPEIAPAHALDVVSRAIRTALGCLLTDEALTRSVARRPSPELLCALVIATTCAPQSTTDIVAAAGKTTVPGFPASNLADENGPWQHALAAASELGAPVDVFWEHVAEHGLLIPVALLGKGGWPALWSRAHR